MPRCYYSDPREGTAKYRILQRLLQKPGITMDEAHFEEGIDIANFSSILNSLEVYSGYDIRRYPVKNKYAMKKRAQGISAREYISAYIIVGRDYWDRRYESYIDPSEFDELRQVG